ncbi:LuxR family transcriptional regulator [Marinobacter hydrocarbonoclasticus]|nr:LuxR family transcriptional regulator [Marinobacter nauticus]
MDIEVLGKLFHCHSEDGLNIAFKTITADMGIERFCFFRISNSTGEVLKAVGDYPQDWINQYFECGYVDIDPTISVGKVTASQFTWPYVQRLFERTKALNEYWNEAASFNMSNGVSDVLFTGTNLSGLGYVLPRRESAEKWLTEHGERLRVLSTAFYQQVNQLATQSKINELMRKLTARERECAQWLAMGLTAAQAARKMKISERTVRFHLEKLKFKCDVKTKEQVIVTLAYHHVIEDLNVRRNST